MGWPKGKKPPANPCVGLALRGAVPFRADCISIKRRALRWRHAELPRQPSPSYDYEEFVWQAEDAEDDACTRFDDGDSVGSCSRFQECLAILGKLDNLDPACVTVDWVERASAVSLSTRQHYLPVAFHARDWNAVIENALIVLSIENNTEALYWKGMASAQLGTKPGLKQAVHDLGKVVESDPDNELALEHLHNSERCLQMVSTEHHRVQEDLFKRASFASEGLRAAASRVLSSRPGTPPSSQSTLESLEKWQKQLQAIEPARSEDGKLSREDVKDIERLARLLGEDEQPPFELRVDGDRPILITAPHAVYLLRDGQEPHVAEEYTAEIASVFSRDARGALISWTTSEQQRSSTLWSLANRRGTDPCSLLDPRNRDPNYLSSAELPDNPWFRDVLCLSSAWRERFGKNVRTLHIDVHGCRNPPDSASHLTVGLGAMFAAAQRHGPAAVAHVEMFRSTLETELQAVLSRIRLHPPGKMVSVVTGARQTGKSFNRFTGAWLESSQRQTQTQQAVGFAGFAESVQLEISKALRIHLQSRGKVMRSVCSAIRAAWLKSKSKSS